MILGAQLYTVRDYCKDAEGLENTLGKIAAMGYTSVQISGIGPIEPKEVRKICDKVHLQIVITHINPEQLLQDPAAVAAVHEEYGCRFIGIGAMPERYRRGAENIRAFIRDFKGPAEYLRRRGMSFHYHNHSFEFEKYDGKTGFDILIEESEPDLLHFILDTFWVQHGGASPADYIRKLQGRIDALHLKDFAIQDGKQKFASIGSGNMNWDVILHTAQETGIPFAMIEQDGDFADDPISELERSYRYLSGKGYR